jgi:hypothetical protein
MYDNRYGLLRKDQEWKQSCSLGYNPLRLQIGFSWMMKRDSARSSLFDQPNYSIRTRRSCTGQTLFLLSVTHARALGSKATSNITRSFGGRSSGSLESTCTSSHRHLRHVTMVLPLSSCAQGQSSLRPQQSCSPTFIPLEMYLSAQRAVAVHLYKQLQERRFTFL